MINEYCSVIETPLGELTILAHEESIHTITFSKTESSSLAENNISYTAAMQLKAYFEGSLQNFSFLLQQEGTSFQQNVWKALEDIKYGYTTSYAKFSEQLNNILAIRAIAAANGKNKIAIVVPCHRVIGSNGKLVGYAGGLWRKQWLLDHEREISKQGQMTLKF